ncbi:MAG: hypothetical protein EBR01_02675 [Proteobacteria bacterium]|nr:hypothetical protein [Pseudomonadota bacterium]
MLKVIFKGLDRSELAREAAENKLEEVMSRFPELQQSTLAVTLGMENSSRQAGADVFTVKLRIETGKYRGVILEKSAPNLYSALGAVAEHLLERLNRFSDKARVKSRNQERKLSSRA